MDGKSRFPLSRMNVFPGFKDESIFICSNVEALSERFICVKGLFYTLDRRS